MEAILSVIPADFFVATAFISFGCSVDQRESAPFARIQQARQVAPQTRRQGTS